MDSDKVLLFGHRGAAGEAPENTLSGFAYARGAGVSCFETDVRMARDGQLVLLHDVNLVRTTGREGTVDQFSAAELASMNACQLFPGWPDQDGIPSLHQVLERFHDRIMHWQLEIKTDLVERLAQGINQLYTEICQFDLRNRVTITSFNPKAIQLVRERAPELDCGLIAEFRNKQDLSLPYQLGCRNVCLPLSSSSKLVAEAAKKMGMQTTGWLGNQPEQLHELLEWQVDAITTDFPSMALKYLARYSAAD